MIEGVLLDVDGTLVDSNTAHARAWDDAFSEAGLSDRPSLEEIRRAIGMGGDKLLPAVLGLSEDTELGRQLAERRAAIFKSRYLSELEPTRGAADLVAALRDRGLQLGVATSARTDELRALLERAGVPVDLAARAASVDDVEGSKPDPDVIEAAVEAIGLPADSVVLIGDTPYDVEAATRAGVAVIAVRSGGWSDGDLDGAVAVFDDPAALVEQLDETLARTAISRT